jgi:serine/threonine protein kinase
MACMDGRGRGADGVLVGEGTYGVVRALSLTASTVTKTSKPLVSDGRARLVPGDALRDVVYPRWLEDVAAACGRPTPCARVLTWHLSALAPCCVLELDRGVPLMDWTDAGHASIADRRKVAWRLVDAAACMTAAGMHHCDLKPANVVVGPGLAPWLVDWGLACPASARWFNTAFQGTCAFRAPEIGSSRSHDLEAADVWAVGATLLEVFGVDLCATWPHVFVLLEPLDGGVARAAAAREWGTQFASRAGLGWRHPEVVAAGVPWDVVDLVAAMVTPDLTVRKRFADLVATAPPDVLLPQAPEPRAPPAVAPLLLVPPVPAEALSALGKLLARGRSFVPVLGLAVTLYGITAGSSDCKVSPGACARLAARLLTQTYCVVLEDEDEHLNAAACLEDDVALLGAAHVLPLPVLANVNALAVAASMLAGRGSGSVRPAAVTQLGRAFVKEYPSWVGATSQEFGAKLAEAVAAPATCCGPA